MIRGRPAARGGRECRYLRDHLSTTPEPVAGAGGVWDPISYAVDATGQPLVLFGTADPDCGVYAVNALTGALVWRFQSLPDNGNYDIGAGVVVSPPGDNGFADGVAYVESRWGNMYALDLTTGAQIWSYNFEAQTGAGSSSTAALSGTDLVFGTAGGVDELNAVTGQLNWRYSEGDTNPIESSPAIVGPAGSQVVAIETESGKVTALSLASGALLYNYQTGNYNVSSVADVAGNLLAASADDFLYDFAIGGGNAPPTTAATSPAPGATVSNPSGSVTISGTSQSSAAPVTTVDVYLQADGSAGPWWDSATGTWVAAPYPNAATITDAHGDWTFTAAGAGGGRRVGGLRQRGQQLGSGGHLRRAVRAQSGSRQLHAAAQQRGGSPVECRSCGARGLHHVERFRFRGQRAGERFAGRQRLDDHHVGRLWRPARDEGHRADQRRVWPRDAGGHR